MTDFARQLRQRQTLAERVLWEQLRDRRLAGLKFRRQLPLDPYVVDFGCVEPKIVIELDGPVHAEQRDYDEARTEFLETHGYTVLRFDNEDVLNNLPAVLQRIAAVSSALLRHPSPPLGRGAGGEGAPTGAQRELIRITNEPTGSAS